MVVFCSSGTDVCGVGTGRCTAGSPIRGRECPFGRNRQRFDRAAFPAEQLLRQHVHLGIKPIAYDKAVRGVEHAQALRHVPTAG